MTPIIYFGLDRSGTTWLGNLLGHHLNLSVVSHQEHFGILESAPFAHQRYFESLPRESRFGDFFNQYVDSDYFLVAGISQNHFKDKEYDDFYSFFFDLMDAVAEKDHCEHWITKLDQAIFVERRNLDEFMKRLNERYGTSKLIYISRDFESYIKSKFKQSSANLGRRFHWKRIFLLVYSSAQYYHLNRRMEEFTTETSGCHTRYEQLRHHRDLTISKIASEIDLPVDVTDEYQAQRRNTSNDLSGSFPSFWSKTVKIVLGKCRWLNYLICKAAYARSFVVKVQNPLWFRLRQTELR